VGCSGRRYWRTIRDVILFRFVGALISLAFIILLVMAVWIIHDPVLITVAIVFLLACALVVVRTWNQMKTARRQGVKIS
jgi:uncharacterized membrane protein